MIYSRTFARRALTICLAVTTGSLTHFAGGQSTIYGISWDAGVVRVDAVTGVRSVILSDPAWSDLTAITVDSDGSHLLLGGDRGYIIRTDLAGSIVDTLLTMEDFRDLHAGRGGSPCAHGDLWIDETDQKLYATGSGWCGSHFVRMNLDGSELEWMGGVHTGGSSMAIHPDTRRVYLAIAWPPAHFAGILSRDLDTANPDTLIRSDSTLGSAQFDFTSGKMYWASGDSAAILSANLDGSGVEKLSALPWRPWYTSLALDTDNRHLYYTPTFGGERNPNTLYRVSLDGSEAVEVGDGLFRDMIVKTNTPTAKEISADFPSGLALHQNHPNPFNPTTTISYSLPSPEDVTLAVVDMLGREVRVLATGVQLAGAYNVTFDATGLPSGVYVYRLRAGSYVEARRMVLVR